MAQIPIVQSLHQEFVLYVTMIETEHTMDQVCEEIAKTSIGFDKNRRSGAPLRVRKQGEEKPFPREMKVADAGVGPMETLEFYYED